MDTLNYRLERERVCKRLLGREERLQIGVCVLEHSADKDHV